MIFDIYAFWIGTRKAYQNLLEAKMMTPEEALELGAVDELCSPEELLPKAEERMKRYLTLGSICWQHSKLNIRDTLISKLEASDFDTDLQGDS